MAKPKAIDLFAGGGGLSLGLRMAGFRVVGAVEIDPLAVETYRGNHRRVKVWSTDIRTLDPGNVRRELSLRVGELDLLAGCPPCQGFSTLTTLNGKRRKRDPRNGLVSEFTRFVREFLPKTVMLENVPGITEHGIFRSILRDLIELGYGVKYDVLNAADYGVPQNRRRFILIGSRKGAVHFAEKSAASETVRTAFAKLRGTANDELHGVAEDRSERVAAIIRSVPRDGGSRSSLKLPLRLKCHRGFDGFRDVYGRMAWDRPSPTITGGCCNPSKGRFLHPTKDRCITLREAAVLQSFPPDYYFSLSRGKFAAAQMIGNALPPEFIRRHALALKNALRAS